MKIWIVETGEPLPIPIDQDTRKLRAGMLIDALCAAGHSVDWWATTFDHFHKRQRFPEPQTIAVNPLLTIRLLHSRGYRHNVSFARLRHNRSIANHFAAEALRAPRPDVILCCMPTPELAEQSVKLGGQIGVPVIIDIRDVWPDVYLTALPAAVRRPAKALLHNHYRRFWAAVSSADSLTAVSDTYLDWSLKIARRSKRELDIVFPLGFPTSATDLPRPSAGDTNEFLDHQRIPRGSVLFSFAGTFGSSYDLATVIQAARALGQSKDNKIHFLIAGDGDNGKSPRKLAENVENVTFLGWLDRLDLQRLLLLSDVGIAPYIRSAPQSLPNKIYEYMAAGLPILSSLEGEACDLLTDERIGLTYSPENVASLVSNVRTLAAQTDFRRAMGARALNLFNSRYRASHVYQAMAGHIVRLGTEHLGQWA
jgi:glycosyltransferase involved in cell wall biosynthesis